MLPELDPGAPMSTPSKHAPYISLVVAARNDNHGGNMLTRMQAFLNAWLGQAKKYGLPSEIVIVEWNPPPNRPKLIDVLRWPMDTAPCEVRFIEVSSEVHGRFRNANTIPLHQMIAKNAGIRRARGEFVLATNLDIVFSPELMQFLAERRLERRTLYRIDRHDVASEIPNPASAEQLTAYCDSHIVRLFTAEGGFELERDGRRKLEVRDIVQPDAGIRFGARCYPVDSDGTTLFRWLADDSEIILQRPAGACSLFLDAETGPSAGTSPVGVEIVESTNSVLASASLKGRCQLRLHIPNEISAATLRFRIQSSGLPLERDVRNLSFRLFGLSWETPDSLPESDHSGFPYSGEGESIRVRSRNARRIQLELNPGSGSTLASLEANLSDLAGKTLFHVSTDQLQPLLGQGLLTIDVGFKLSGADDSQGSVDPAWRLELIACQPGVDWNSAFEAPSPEAALMRNPVHLHTNGCGDFTLLSRQDWLDLRGYAEFPIWPMHIDSLFCYAAHHAGVREVVLREPLRIFHIEHQSGAGWTPEGEKELNERIKSKGVGRLQNDDVVKWIDQMRRFNAPVIFMQENWGLADVELPETTIGSHNSTGVAPVTSN
jgi:hypothetical protein